MLQLLHLIRPPFVRDERNRRIKLVDNSENKDFSRKFSDFLAINKWTKINGNEVKRLKERVKWNGTFLLTSREKPNHDDLLKCHKYFASPSQ